MRPKVVAPVIVASVLLCASLLWLNKLGRTSTDISGLPPSSEREMDRPDWPGAKQIVPKSETINPPAEEKDGLAFETATNAFANDSTSVIQNLLIHSDKDGWEEALEKIKESGDSNAIPALKTASEWTTNVEEKIELLEAAEFLSLPRLTFDPSNIQKISEERTIAEKRRASRRLADERDTRERHKSPVDNNAL